MKKKIYSDNVVNDLFNIMRAHVDGGRCVEKLNEIYNELTVPAVKYALIKDLSTFLSDWFKLVNDTKNIDPIKSKVTLGKILCAEFINSDSYIRHLIYACNKCGRSNRQVNVAVSYARACIKAVIMTKRRSLGFDRVGSKFVKEAN